MYIRKTAKGDIFEIKYSLLVLGTTIDLPIKVSIRNPDWKGDNDNQNLPYILSPQSDEEIRRDDGGESYFKEFDGKLDLVFPNGGLERNLKGTWAEFGKQDWSKLCFLHSSRILGIDIAFYPRNNHFYTKIDYNTIIKALQKKERIAEMINHLGFQSKPEDMNLYDGAVSVYKDVIDYDNQGKRLKESIEEIIWIKG